VSNIKAFLFSSWRSIASLPIATSDYCKNSNNEPNNVHLVQCTNKNGTYLYGIEIELGVLAELETACEDVANMDKCYAYENRPVKYSNRA